MMVPFLKWAGRQPRYGRKGIIVQMRGTLAPLGRQHVKARHHKLYSRQDAPVRQHGEEWRQATAA